MLKIEFTTKMKSDIKRMKKRGKDLQKLRAMLLLLANREPIPAVYKDHALQGKFKGSRECHIEPDWLLIYEIHEDVVLLLATDTGTHSDLF